MSDQRIAVVTGAAGAIGIAISAALAADGLRVIRVDRDVEALKRTATTFADATDVTELALDIVDEAAVQQAFEDLVTEHGRLDVVVNNAGITRDRPLHKMSLADFRDVVEVNLIGTFLMSRAAFTHMRGRPGGGRIVNIASMAAKVANFGQANYSASKAGVVALTRVTAREGARFDITANAVSPGFIETPMTAALAPDVVAARVESIPLGRAGQPTEVADAVRWLASPGAGYVTGTVVDVAGGRGL
jgi:NAD(P)-dependent dehydrogenase (short-subunit alcohol dehydrogenase family)